VLDHQKYGQQQEEDRTGVSRRRPVVIWRRIPGLDPSPDHLSALSHHFISDRPERRGACTCVCVCAGRERMREREQVGWSRIPTRHLNSQLRDSGQPACIKVACCRTRVTQGERKREREREKISGATTLRDWRWPIYNK
jgi:hypothetical protein